MGASLIAKEQAIEVARIEKEIAVTQSLEQQARAEAAKALAMADEERAKQSIATVESNAIAEREKAIRVIQAEAQASEQTIAAEAKAVAALKEAEATVTLANAAAHRGSAEAATRRRVIEAENAVALKFVLRDVALRAIDRMPELARELMAPAHAIREIRVLQTGGVTGAMNGGGAPSLGAMSPILKSIMEAGAAYPLLRELMQFAKADPDRLVERAQSALDGLTTEVQSILKAEEGGLGAETSVSPSAEGSNGPLTNAQPDDHAP